MTLQIRSPEVRKAAQKEGYKNIQEVVDEVEGKEPVVPHFSLDVPEKIESLTPQQLEIYEKVLNLTESAAERTKEIFHAKLDTLPVSNEHQREKIIKYIKEKRLDYPTFKLRFGREADKMLETVGLEPRFGQEPRKGVLLFQLPKPLAKFWRKGSEDKDDKGMDMQGTVIEWGKIYRSVTPVIWRTLDEYYESEGLDLDRINAVGEHDPNRYYYVWLLDKSRPPKFPDWADVDEQDKY